MKTYRFRGHFEGDPERYRDDEERRTIQANDPLPPFRERLVEAGAATEEELDALQREIEAAVDEAVDFARASPFPDPAELERYVYPEQRG